MKRYLVVSLRYRRSHSSGDGSMWLRSFMGDVIRMNSADLEILLI